MVLKTGLSTAEKRKGLKGPMNKQWYLPTKPWLCGKTSLFFWNMGFPRSALTRKLIFPRFRCSPPSFPSRRYCKDDSLKSKREVYKPFVVLSQARFLRSIWFWRKPQGTKATCLMANFKRFKCFFTADWIFYPWDVAIFSLTSFRLTRQRFVGILSRSETNIDFLKRPAPSSDERVSGTWTCKLWTNQLMPIQDQQNWKLKLNLDLNALSIGHA